MTQFKVIYYIVLVMSFLLMLVFGWGFFTYNRKKSKIKFLNKPLVGATLGVGLTAFVIAWIPIFLQVWNLSDLEVRSFPFVLILIFEFIFLVAFLIFSYVFAFDFGIVLDKQEERLQFFGQEINTNKIIDLEEKKHGLKIVYNQGARNLTKRVTVYTPGAKKFVKEFLKTIISSNKRQMQSKNNESEPKKSEQIKKLEESK